MSCMNIRNIILTAFMVFLWPATASAHLVSTGFGPFYDGITHLAMSPDDLLGVLAIGLLSGLLGAQHGRVTLFALPLTWLIGGVIGLQFEIEISLPVLSAISFLIVGMLVAADKKLPLAFIYGLAMVLGLLHGFLNGTAMAQAGGGFLALFGISVAVFVLVALLAALVVSLRAQWARITVRVAGSWITAIGLLMLGWTYRGMG
ncbi:MAG: HupE/UreJ family protein [Desulfobacteria bacterium]